MEKPENLILPEKLILNEQTSDENREKGSSGIMMEIRGLIGRRLNTAMFLAVLASTAAQFACEKTEETTMGEMEIGQKAKSGEKIIGIYEELGGKKYKSVRLENDKVVFIDPVTLEILKAKSGERIAVFYGDEKDKELGGKKYKSVRFEHGGDVLIDIVTLEIPKTKSGERIAVFYGDEKDKELGGKKYKFVKLENTDYVFIDLVTLEIPKTKSGEKIYRIYDDEELGGKKYKSVRLEDGKLVLIDPVTLEILKTKSGERIIGSVLGKGEVE